VPRLPGVLGLPPVGAKWGTTRLRLDLPETEWTDVLTGARLRMDANPLLSDLLAVLPCAVLAA